MLTFGDKEEFFPTITADGKTLVYEQWQRSADEPRKAIYYANVDGGNQTLAWNLSPGDEWRCPLLSGKLCFLRENHGSDLVFYTLDLENGRGVKLARCTREPTLLGDWSLSPDGKTAALPNHDDHSPSIRLIHLDGAGPETTIRVRQTAQLRGIHWTVDGHGFYAAVYVGQDHRLEFIALNGEVRPLRSTQGDSWIVPSPDGKRLAFVDSSMSRNVFLWK